MAEESIDGIAWDETYDEDLWVFDKFILSRRLGYICGAKGTSVPSPDYYVVRPCINFMGMGASAEITYIEEETDHLLKDGFFWCEVFKGRHLSVDFYNGKQDLCVEGFKKDENNLTKWSRWEKTKDIIEYPSILKKLKRDYEWINIEYIGGKIIEIHLRNNPDFKGHKSHYVIPVWKDENIKPPKDCIFLSRPDADRLGFYIKEEKGI